MQCLLLAKLFSVSYQQIMAEQIFANEIAIGSPITLPCGVTLPNRLAKAAMTEVRILQME